jgi:hypothetical protein
MIEWGAITRSRRPMDLCTRDKEKSGEVLQNWKAFTAEFPSTI